MVTETKISTCRSPFSFISFILTLTLTIQTTLKLRGTVIGGGYCFILIHPVKYRLCSETKCAGSLRILDAGFPLPPSGSGVRRLDRSETKGVFKFADVKMGYRANLALLLILRWSNWLISVSSLTLYPSDSLTVPFYTKASRSSHYNWLLINDWFTE